MPLAPVQRHSAASAAFEQLLEEVLSGSTPAGQTLPPERSLTDILKVNRQAVREALQRLAQAGLVEIQHGGGTTVLDHRRTASMDLLPRLLIGEGGGLDPHVGRSIMEMRQALGPVVAETCARRASSEVIERLLGVLTEGEGTHDLEVRAQLDLTFWDALVDGSDNIAYRLAFNSLRRTYEPLMEVLLQVLQEELHAWDRRREIVVAVSDHDPDGARHSAEQLLQLGTGSSLRWFEAQGGDA